MKNIIDYVLINEMSADDYKKIEDAAMHISYNSVTNDTTLNLLKQIILYFANNKIQFANVKWRKDQQKETVKMCKEIKSKMGW